jgi:hypothetical protein
MSERSETSSNGSMSFAAGSPARTSAAVDHVSGSPAPRAAFGQNTDDWLASFDHRSWSWRTSQTCLFGGWAPFSETWPRSGMTRNGTAFRLPTLVIHKRGSASGLLPTLVKADARQVCNGSRRERRLCDGLTMTDWVRLRLGRKRVPIDLSESMMGFPIGFTALEPSETASFRTSQSGSDVASSKPKG